MKQSTRAYLAGAASVLDWTGDSPLRAWRLSVAHLDPTERLELLSNVRTAQWSTFWTALCCVLAAVGFQLAGYPAVSGTVLVALLAAFTALMVVAVREKL